MNCMANSEIPSDAIREAVVRSIDANNGAQSGEIDVHFSTPDELDESDWPVQISDLIRDDTIERGENEIRIHANEQVKETIQLRRRNATGGDYLDVVQEIGIDAVFPKEPLQGNTGEMVLAEQPSKLEFECHIEDVGGRSVPGERPPF